MAKTNMVEREHRRERVAKKYATKRAQLKEIIRSPKSTPEQRAAAQAALQQQPRDASQEPPSQSLRDHRPLARRVPQIRTGPRQDPGSRDAR